jgi:hypothetical protein
MTKKKIFACRTMEAEIREVLPEDVDCEFLEYGLHSYPDKLRQELQLKIEEAGEYETLLFGYGLCSNGVTGLKSKHHTMILPRVHDCISLLLGSRKQYDNEFNTFPGTYYLSKGWIQQKGDPLASYLRYLEKYGEETANWVIREEYKNYQRVVFIRTVGNCEEDIKYSKEVADFLNLQFSEAEGSVEYIRKLVHGEWDKEFLIIPPGKSISLYNFL